VKIELLNEKYSIYKVAHDKKGTIDINKYPFLSLAITKEEVSVVCETGLFNDYEKEESGWILFRVLGPLDFSLIGIISKLSTILADEKISIFIISTFDTDYIMIKEVNKGKAIRALKRSGYEIMNENT